MMVIIGGLNDLLHLLQCIENVVVYFLLLQLHPSLEGVVV